MIEQGFTLDLLVRMCSVAPEECKELIANETHDRNFTIPPLTPEVIDQSTVHLYSDLSGKICNLCNFYINLSYSFFSFLLDAQISVTIENQTLMAYEVR